MKYSMSEQDATVTDWRFRSTKCRKVIFIPQWVCILILKLHNIRITYEKYVSFTPLLNKTFIMYVYSRSISYAIKFSYNSNCCVQVCVVQLGIETAGKKKEIKRTGGWRHQSVHKETHWVWGSGRKLKGKMEQERAEGGGKKKAKRTFC